MKAFKIVEKEKDGVTFPTFQEVKFIKEGVPTSTKNKRSNLKPKKKRNR